MRRLAGVLGAALALIAATMPAVPAMAAESAESRMVNALNQMRKARGLPRVTAAPTLTASASRYAAQLAGSGRLTHSNAILAPGFGQVAELLARMNSTAATPSDVVALWMISPAHRVALVRPMYRYAGVGVARGPCPVGTCSFWVVRLAAPPGVRGRR